MSALELEPEWRMRLRNCWRLPFVAIHRRWPTDRHWRGGKWPNVLRVALYEMCFGCPPDWRLVVLLARFKGQARAVDGGAATSFGD